MCDLFNVSKIGATGKEARAHELRANIQAQLEHNRELYDELFAPPLQDEVDPQCRLGLKARMPKERLPLQALAPLIGVKWYLQIPVCTRDSKGCLVISRDNDGKPVFKQVAGRFGLTYNVDKKCFRHSLQFCKKCM